ncbi:glycolate oxidase subunit GlcE [Thiohalophilus thiocyanatoxydans]|uniref:Glycolate oxidase FAD binding subunit n=1 Tax=Thiohalophilus thiocyanatoxydans TaxID=381308 RepID=A0A4R8J1Y8_9GAMM|nr:glycolate oxidase subunit GlcE [Thiohalophilus thiocyanatoxydans]TDY04209.1 glycolate oxidase FAD binding subunit [Thiohalophilus thiocyanatoxydans]
MADISEQLQQQVRSAVDSRRPLSIHARKTKSFYGHPVEGTPLDVSGHNGILHYEPTELVITARAGTPLPVIEQTLAEEGQMLAFEPPHFGEAATLGGTIACNLSGPRRAYAGAARDFVLGCKLINGQGEILQFGGEVMKNVAGYDVSRLMAGALGTLGVLLEVSLKVLPRAESEQTVVLETSDAEAIERMNGWARKPLPITATCYDGASLYVRLAGTQSTIRAARKVIGGEEMPPTRTWWNKLKEQQHAFFSSSKPLWRLSLASNTPPIKLDGKWLYEWGGAQRWLVSEEPAERIRRAVEKVDGHATLYRGAGNIEVFHPLPEAMMKVQRNLKQAFDPERIFNPGRMYKQI